MPSAHSAMRTRQQFPLGRSNPELRFTREKEDLFQDVRPMRPLLPPQRQPRATGTKCCGPSALQWLCSQCGWPVIWLSLRLTSGVLVLVSPLTLFLMSRRANLTTATCYLRAISRLWFTSFLLLVAFTPLLLALKLLLQ